ncbi:hypothetical protein [Nocardia canadensis]|uniref:hypothetical protein n=1 Tax=Nocardia canadensis TaxID=3065238 RepID=UPI002931E92C|nr:hypothetical protein [Nocardia canadensis]
MSVETPEQTTTAADAPTRPATEPRRRPRSVSFSLNAVIGVAAAVAAVAIMVTLGGLLWSARAELAAQRATADDQRRAEQIAADYAVGASTINYQDLNPWFAELKSNTAPALANKFDATAPALREILVPLKWTSNSTPITAKVMSEANGLYQVNVFVNVTSTSAQAPEGGQSTVTYTVSVDRGADWKITDVGGMNGALPIK